MTAGAFDKRTRRAWLAAGSISLVALLTAAFVAAVVLRVADNEAFSLEIGAQPAAQASLSAPAQANPAQANQTQAQAQAAQVLQAAQGASPSTAREAAEANPGAQVRDENGTTWTAEAAQIVLFKQQYASPDGATATVDSADGEKVVAPGTGNAYDFSVRNTTGSEASYSLVIQSSVNVDDVYLPLEGRVSNDGRWTVGDADTWVPLAEMGVLENETTLAPAAQENYRFEWRWPFEREDGDGLAANDAHDTSLSEGVNGQDVEATATLSVVASYVEDPSDGDNNGGGGNNGNGTTPGTASTTSTTTTTTSTVTQGSADATGNRPPLTGDALAVVPALVAGLLAALVAAGAWRRSRERGKGRDAGTQAGAR